MIASLLLLVRYARSLSLLAGWAAGAGGARPYNKLYLAALYSSMFSLLPYFV